MNAHYVSHLQRRSFSHMICVLPTQASIIWKIKGFSSQVSAPDIHLSSVNFEYSNATWQVQIYPNGETHNGTVGEVVLYLRRLSSLVPVHRLNLKFSFKDLSGHDEHAVRIEAVFVEGNCTSCGTKPQIFLKELLDGKFGTIFVEDVLVISCDISHTEVYESGFMEMECQLNCLNSLCEDFKKLCESGDNADITLKAGQKQFPAHKAILEARSEVFSAMFKQNNTSNVVEIGDCDPFVLKEVLLYIYTGRVEDMTTNNVELFTVADKFDLKELRSYCLHFMKSHLSVDNVCEIIKLAEKYNEADLGTKAKRFLHRNTSEVIASKAWVYFSRENPVLALDLLQYVLHDRECEKSEETESHSTNTLANPQEDELRSCGIQSKILMAIVLIFALFLVQSQPWDYGIFSNF